jgi:two-component system catabolic regulation response regulator CreB
MNGELLVAATILLIEDEPAIADSLTYALTSEGFQCEWKVTGSEGLAFIESGACDLVLLDVGLPDINGFDLCKSIRAKFDVPIIFLTARSDEIDRVVGLEIGGDDYVSKPFSPREVAARVRAVLRRFQKAASPAPQPQTEPEVPQTGFYIDEARHAIFYRGERLTLSRYEFRLLKILVERPGWVFSREQLMEMAWDAPEASMDRTVDAHIKLLRSKLRAIHPDDPIVTHRGVGYSLKETA